MQPSITCPVCGTISYNPHDIEEAYCAICHDWHGNEMSPRAKHLAWCKVRALAYIDAGDLVAAFSSMISDLEKHEKTAGHPAIRMGMKLMVNDQLNTPELMRGFIKGFN